MITQKYQNTQTFAAEARAAGAELDVTLAFVSVLDLHVRAGATSLVRGIDYSLTYEGSVNEVKFGCTLTLLKPQTAAIAVSRVTSMYQLLSLALNGRLPGPALEWQLDRLALALQDLSYITLTVEEAAATYLSLAGAAATYVSIDAAEQAYMPIAWAAGFAPMSHVNWSAGHVPTTGAVGSFLKKTADGSEWADLDGVFVSVAEAAETYLSKSDAAALATKTELGLHTGYSAVHVPLSGTNGYYLKKTENGPVWAEVEGGGAAVWGGITGDIEDQLDIFSVFATKDLVEATYATKVALNTHSTNLAIHVPSTGTTGYYLKKTANGCEWAEVSGGGGGGTGNAVTYSVAWMGTQTGSGKPVLYTGEEYMQRRGHVFLDKDVRAGTNYEDVPLLAPQSSEEEPVASVDIAVTTPSGSAFPPAQKRLVWLQEGSYSGSLGGGLASSFTMSKLDGTSQTVDVTDYPSFSFSISQDGWYVMIIGVTDEGTLSVVLERSIGDGWAPAIQYVSPTWEDITPPPRWGRILGDIDSQVDLAAMYMKRLDEVRPVPDVGVSPGHVYVKSLIANSTLGVKAPGSGYAGRCHIFINPGACTLVVDAGVTLVDALMASKVNFCEVLFAGDAARLYVLDTWDGDVPVPIGELKFELTEYSNDTEYLPSHTGFSPIDVLSYGKPMYRAIVTGYGDTSCLWLYVTKVNGTARWAVCRSETAPPDVNGSSDGSTHMAYSSSLFGSYTVNTDRLIDFKFDDSTPTGGSLAVYI